MDYILSQMKTADSSSAQKQILATSYHAKLDLGPMGY